MAPDDQVPAAGSGRQDRAQSGLQWAVRWHGVVLFLLLIGSVPLVHLAWHWIAGQDEPVVATRNQRPRPRFSWSRTRTGQWQWSLDEEQYLQEASPVVWWLRGNYNELRYLLGLYASDSVAVGRDGWMFMPQSLHPDEELLRRSAERRARFLARLRARADQLGVRLLVAVCPDKERLYPEYIYADGRLPPAKERLYPQILAELRQAGIEAVDLWQPLADLRKTANEEIYYRRDTHWRPIAAMAAARAIAAAVEHSAGPLLGPRRPVELQRPLATRVLPDIASMAGFLAFEEPTGSPSSPSGAKGPGNRPSLAASLLTERLQEDREYYALAVRGPDGTLVPSEQLAQQATVLLAGTSFSIENGATAVQYALERPVRVVAYLGAAGTNALGEALHLLATGECKAKVLVWEFVERGYLEPAWLQVAVPGL
jgi:hypothetical protein